MCGIFGFLGSNPELNLLKDAGREAGRRGPHAFGVACPGAIVRNLGCLSDNLDALSTCSGKWVIGNARLATFGDYNDERNTQPLDFDGNILSHNGNVYNYRSLYEQMAYQPRTDNDSEALLAVAIFHPHWREIVAQIALASPLAALMRMGGTFYTIRLGHPLYALSTPSGAYFCSRSFAPGCEPVPPGIVSWGDA